MMAEQQPVFTREHEGYLCSECNQLASWDTESEMWLCACYTGQEWPFYKNWHGPDWPYRGEMPGTWRPVRVVVQAYEEVT